VLYYWCRREESEMIGMGAVIETIRVECPECTWYAIGIRPEDRPVACPACGHAAAFIAAFLEEME
jgi:hypothetical protein